MDLFGAQPTTLAPGQRILKLKGYNAVDRYSMPRDCEAFFLDEDEDVGYIKNTGLAPGIQVPITLIQVRPGIRASKREKMPFMLLLRYSGMSSNSPSGRPSRCISVQLQLMCT